jgi:acyl-CoA synthetase (AMP-forming)/AMP-acid ligase II
MVVQDSDRLKIPFRTLGAAFADFADRHPDKLAIHSIDQRQSVAFGPLRDLVDRTAARMRALGVDRGSRVAILSGECLEKLGAISARPGWRGRSP